MEKQMEAYGFDGLRVLGGFGGLGFRVYCSGLQLTDICHILQLLADC